MTHFLDLTPLRARFAPKCPRSAFEEFKAMERRRNRKNFATGILGGSTGGVVGLLVMYFAVRGLIVVVRMMFP